MPKGHLYMTPKDVLRLTSAILGFIAIGCILAIGGYITAWCWNIYSTGLGASFLPLTITTWLLTFASMLLLIYGSLKIVKKSALKGGIINLIASVETLLIFLYFYTYLPLLPQFAFLSFLLFLPALLSGIISLASYKIFKT